MSDLRGALRQMLKNRGFTALVVLSLALGIGANTAMFSVIHQVVWRPLPYRDSGRLALLCERHLPRGYRQTMVAAANLFDWRARNTVFEDLAGEAYETFNLSGAEAPEHLHGAYVTANYFSLLGVSPALGRTFAAGEDQPGHSLAVLSDGLWRRRFGADAKVVGSPINLNGKVYTVVGVMPREFRCFNPTTVTGRPTGDVQPQLWVVYQFTPEESQNRAAKYFLGLGRLKPGVTFVQAQNEMSAIAERLAQEFPRQNGWGVNVRSLPEQIVGGARPALATLLGAVAFVLLIACANVANLLLARSAARAKEFAIRAALGASRARVIRQLLTESLLLAAVSGGLGLALAEGVVQALRAFGPANVPRMDEVALDAPALGFTLLVSVVTGLLFGLAPALQAARTDLNESLQAAARGAVGGFRRQRGRRLLVASEVALALMLLAGAGLMVNSFARLARVDPGFAPGRLIAFDVALSDTRYAELSTRVAAAGALRARLREIPGVVSVATACGLPFGTMLNIGTRVSGESRAAAVPGEQFIGVGWRLVSPEYFRTMNISLRSGRAFTEQDTTRSAPVAIINETLGRKLYPAEDPVGKRINVHSSTTNLALSTNWCEIVGVIRDVKLTGLDAPVQPEVYRPDLQDCFWMLSVVLNTTLPPASVARLAQAKALAVDREMPIYNLRTMDRAITDSIAARRFTMSLIGIFAALALSLTVIGIYGVISYSVGQRTQEIGIRMALGAPRRAVLALVLREGMGFVGVGLVAGLAGSLALSRVIASQLFGITATDPLTLAGVVALLAGAAFLACLLPARRAAQIDRLVALRNE